MKYFLYLFVFIAISCKQKGESTDDKNVIKDSFYRAKILDIVHQNNLLKDYRAWYFYYYYHIHLSQDFIGLDVDSNKINKASFLQKLSTGNVVPFDIQTKDSLPVYKLYPLNTNDSDIQTAIQQAALNETFNYSKEGEKFPDFNFTDVNNKLYNIANTKGKIIVLKCWFVHCTACVAEFPELNKLVDEYQNRNNIVFVSLATDHTETLIDFLKKKPFEYAVVPLQRDFIEGRLGVNEYPTHFLIDKNGRIVKVTNSISEMIPFIRKETGKS